MSSYLSELNQLVSLQRKASGGVIQSSFDPADVYRELANKLLSRCIWVSYDAYHTMSGIRIVSGKTEPKETPISRVDLRSNAVMSVRSVPLFYLVNHICVDLGGLLERSAITQELGARNSKLVLSAGLRNYDHVINKSFSKELAIDLRKQNRCLVFPLKKLAEKAQLPVDDLIPPSEEFS